MTKIVATVGKQALPVFASLDVLGPSHVLLVHGDAEESAAAAKLTEAEYQRLHPQCSFHLLGIAATTPGKAFEQLASHAESSDDFLGSDIIYGPGTTPQNALTIERWLISNGAESGRMWWPQGANSVLLTNNESTSLRFRRINLEQLIRLSGGRIPGRDQTKIAEVVISSQDDYLRNPQWLSDFSFIVGNGVMSKSLKDLRRSSRYKNFRGFSGNSIARKSLPGPGEFFEALIVTYIARLAHELSPDAETKVYLSVKIAFGEEQAPAEREYDVIVENESRLFVLSCFNTSALSAEKTRNAINRKFREIDGMTSGPSQLIGSDGRAAVIARAPTYDSSKFENARSRLIGHPQIGAKDRRQLFGLDEILPVATRDLPFSERIEHLLSYPLSFDTPPPAVGWLISALSR
jgi:hypothetical protein